jgi:hypothetical protein
MSCDKRTQHPPSHVSPNFFDLPREIRDLIYHEFWRSNPALPNFSQRFPDSNDFYLRYEGSYQAVWCERECGDDHYRICGDANEKQKLPLYFLANKQLLLEALEQSLRRAEWFSTEDSSTEIWAPLSIMPDASCVEDVTLYAGALPPLCYECKGALHLDIHDRFCRWWHEESLSELVNAMGEEEEMGRGIRRLRITASTHKANNAEDELELALLLARFVSGGAQYLAGRLQLSLWHEDLYEIGLYDIVGLGSDVSVVLQTVDESK